MCDIFTNGDPVMVGFKLHLVHKHLTLNYSTKGNVWWKIHVTEDGGKEEGAMQRREKWLNSPHTTMTCGRTFDREGVVD
ncbi:MAG TPA: hypothetical protein VF775_02165, partial [Geobacteraceae bacterium]